MISTTSSITNREKLFGLSLSPDFDNRGRTHSEDSRRSEQSDDYEIEGTDDDQSPFTIDE